MRKLLAFMQVSLDGYFASPDGDIRWAHKQDAEFQAFAAENAKAGGMLLFGRVTYEMMAGYWPTPQAAQNSPEVAEQMNRLPKIVFSSTLDQAPWGNTTLVHDDPAAYVRRIKSEPGPDMATLGSGSIVAQLAQAGLIDEFQVVVNPVILGAGKTLFAGVRDWKNLKLTRTRMFGNGNVLLCYEPAG